MKDIIASNGIDRKSIKILDFLVREDSTSWWDEDKKKYMRKFNGFKYHQMMVFKFLNDSAFLGKITYRVSELEHVPAIDFQFITERSKEYEEQLLKEVMALVLSKARALAEAGGFELKSIDDVKGG